MFMFVSKWCAFNRSAPHTIRSEAKSIIWTAKNEKNGRSSPFLIADGDALATMYLTQYKESLHSPTRRHFIEIKWKQKESWSKQRIKKLLWKNDERILLYMCVFYYGLHMICRRRNALNTTKRYLDVFLFFYDWIDLWVRFLAFPFHSYLLFVFRNSPFLYIRTDHTLSHYIDVSDVWLIFVFVFYLFMFYLSRKTAV